MKASRLRFVRVARSLVTVLVISLLPSPFNPFGELFHRRDQDKSQAIKILGAGQQYLNAIVKDMNGKYWYFPQSQLTSVTEGSGTVKADGSKYALTFVAENEFLAKEVDSTIISGILTPVS